MYLKYEKNDDLILFFGTEFSFSKLVIYMSSLGFAAFHYIAVPLRCCT